MIIKKRKMSLSIKLKKKSYMNMKNMKKNKLL